ncbi:hypothetical protein AC579_6701 [Pseudocercospora musae]|uniref:ADP-ribose 1''-phosphate phosphatase n=1 Tax=Pseudocercospora musae TaxID=113226 RepID=A0A139II76_9PEZI|nr:hypothetical protein AC579_6701 [Pseudocercospora musae]
MSSRGLRSARKRKHEDMNGLDAAVDSSISQPPKRSKTSNTTSKPQGRSKTRTDQTRSNPNKKSPNIQDKNMASSTGRTLTLTESTGDIFSAATPNTLLIHACNTEGSWGAGIAAAFKSHYPSAYENYRDHCHMNGGELWRKAFLIPPARQGECFVGCLFTSRSKGRKKDSPAQILGATGPAMRDLMRQVSETETKIDEVRMCKINSGLFGVKWEKTKAVLEGIQGDFHDVKVISRGE